MDPSAGGDVGVLQMSDDELAKRLQNLGFLPGPIVDSTRTVYQRKLMRLLNKEEVNYSDTEELQHEANDQEIDSFVASSPVASFPATSFPATNFPVTSSPMASSHMNNSQITGSHLSGESFSSPYRYDELRRRPLDRVGNSWCDSPSPAFKHVSENLLHKKITSQQSKPSDASFSVSLSAKLAILFFVLLFAFLFYQNMESGSSNPVPKV